MDDHDAGGAAASALLIFVGPAAVIGHRLAAEIAFPALEVGVVDQDDDDLPANVDVLEIVPLPFRGGHAVSGEDDRRHSSRLNCCLAVRRRADGDLLALGKRHRRRQRSVR